MLCFGLSVFVLQQICEAATAMTQPGQNLICSQRDIVNKLLVFFIIKPLAGEASLWPEGTKIKSSCTCHYISIIRYLSIVIKYCRDSYSRFSLVRKREEVLAPNKR